MNVPIDLATTHTIKTDTLHKTGGEYRLVKLSSGHISQILTLQDVIFANLSAEEQTFLIRKDKAFFEKHFAENNIVLGVVHDGQLIAQSVVINPTQKNPKTGMVDMQLDVKVDKITILQGIIVHPDFQGNRLMTVMVDTWLAIAKEQGRTHALAEVAVDNHYSWSVFMKEGLHIYSIGKDPDDGTQVYNVHAHVNALTKKRLKQEFNQKSAKKDVNCPRADLAQQKKLLSEGYRGIKFDPANGNIKFKALRKKKPPGSTRS